MTEMITSEEGSSSIAIGVSRKLNLSAVVIAGQTDNVVASRYGKKANGTVAMANPNQSIDDSDLAKVKGKCKGVEHR